MGRISRRAVLAGMGATASVVPLAAVGIAGADPAALLAAQWLALEVDAGTDLSDEEFCARGDR